MARAVAKTAEAKQYWNLEGFLDALILELDKAQDTLSVKGLTRRLTYTVKDLSLDLHIFPDYQDGELRFANARPGESGASRISFQLGSITDRQIRETANRPVTRDDVVIDDIEEIDPDVKETLKKVGVKSASDLERMESQDVDLKKVVREKTGEDRDVDYSNLANLINKARRRNRRPGVLGLSATPADKGRVELNVDGHDLMLFEPGHGFPLALLNSQPVDVIDAGADRLRMSTAQGVLKSGSNLLEVALDPYAVMRLEVKG